MDLRPTKSLIDCHVHLAALPDGRNGCVLSPRMLRTALFRFLLWKHGYDPQRPDVANQKYIADLRQELGQSRYVGKAVLLGMDGIYSHTGRLEIDRTAFLISNDYVLKTVAAYPDEFLAGVSINPRRADAVDELDRCAAAGAVLVKVLPNSQNFDPGDPAYRPFYRRLAQLRIPLLSHVGYEFTLIGQDQSLGSPERLQTALDEGAPVIAAHGCSSGLIFVEPHYDTLLRFVEQYPRFYTDLSALTLPNRVRMLFRLRHHPQLRERLLFGTDYPLSVLHLPCWGRVGWRQFKEVVGTRNRFDRQYRVLRSLGLSFSSLQSIDLAS
jgi:predicted TIM-barrel fold metal-dependent hydrolase